MFQSSIEPNRCILPILKLGPDNEVRSVVGTGFIVGDPTGLITAKHLFRSRSLRSDGDLGYTCDLKVATL